MKFKKEGKKEALLNPFSELKPRGKKERKEATYKESGKRNLGPSLLNL